MCFDQHALALPLDSRSFRRVREVPRQLRATLGESFGGTYRVTMRLESAATGIDIEWKTTLPTDIPLSVYPFIIDHVRAMRTTAEDGWPLIEIPERHPHRDEVPRHDAVPMMTAVTFLEVAIAPAGTGLYTSN